MSSYQEMKDRMYGRATSTTQKTSGSNSGGGSVGGSYEDMKNRLFAGSTVFLGDSKTENSLNGWVDRYNKTMEGLSAATTGKYYSRDAIDRYSRDIDSLVQQYDAINDYASVYGFQDSLSHYGKLREIQNAIKQQNGWYEKYRGRGHEDIEKILSGMDAGDERDWLEASRYDVYKTAPDYQQRSQTGLAAFENSKPKDQEEESWLEAIGRYLGKASDTTMALGDTGRMAQEYRKDTTYREPADNWTDDQRNTYGYLYSINPEAASDFAVKTSEGYRQAENQQKLGAIQEWATKNGVNASAGTVAAIAMMPLSLADTLNALTEYNARGTISTPSSPTPGQVSEAITGAVGQSLNDKHGTISSKIPVIGGKGWGDAYQLGTSIANSLLSAYTQGSIGTDILFFGSSAASTMYSKKQQGATDEQAIKMGVLAGLAEAAGEHFSIEGLINMNEANTMKAFFGNVLKQSGIEASEEGFTTLMNNFADQLIMGKDSAFYGKVRTYMSENGMSEQEAKKQAWKDMAEDLAFDMVGGAISGGFSTGIQTGAQKIFGGTQQAQTHHEPLATEKSGNATELANNEENATADSLGAVDDKLSATEAVAKNATTTVGVSKMETVQQTADIESFAQQFGTQANEVRRNYLEGQLKHEPENLQEYQVGFMAAYTIGWNGGKVESLSKHVPYLSQSQREIAFSLGRDAAAAQKAAETKAATAKAPTTKASLGQTAQLVAEDGSNGGTVTIAEIVSMDDSGMTLRLEDGRTVTDEDLDFPEGAEVYSTVMELGMDAESANAIVKASATASIPRAAVAEGIETAYHYGKYGYGMDALLKAKEAAEIPESILQASYQAGEKRRQQRRETAQTEENSAASKATAPERRGKVHFHGKSDTLNDVQKESLRGLEWIADLTGAQIHVEDMGDSEGLSRVNGLYDPADDSIHIDLRAGSDGTGTLLYTAAHEFVHRMRRNNEAAFYRLADFLVEQYGKKGISTDALVKQQMADAAADGIELNYDEAFEEMVADAMEAMFTDTDALTKMEKLKTQDKSLWQEIKDFVLGLAEKIKAAYARLKPDSAEARYVLQMKESIDQIAQLFAEGVMAEGIANNDSTNTKVKYSFAGRGSATADRSALQQAEELARQGVDNETIRQQTGWYKGMDGQWRYEIDDSQMEISDEIINYMQLGELMQHEKLYAAYPDLADISVVFQGLETGVNGSYHPQFDSINLSYRLKNDPIGLKDALVHEIQHAIQHREGFTSGATAASWERKIKAGFDSRRAEDVRKAQETERELRRIQEEEPEFYRDMVELDAMTPDLPRGEVDWETLEKISDDPIEWQQYDARREELEAKYGDTKVWDMNDLLYQREKASKNMGRSGVELYFDTAGEIEARDASNRRSKTPEQRKSSPPRLGNEDTVFAEDSGISADYVGKTADGIEVYETSEKTKNLTWAERKKVFLHLMRQEYRGRTAKFVRNGHAYYAQFEYRDVSKNIYGDESSDQKGRDAKINVGADGNIFELVENAKYLRSEPERGKDHRMHRGVNYWDYFVKTVQIDGSMFDLTANVRKKADGQYVYVIEMHENKEIEPSSPEGSQTSGLNGVPNSSIISISNSESEVNQKFSRRKQSETETLKEQNQKLQEDVTRLKELMKLQGKVTHGKIMKPSSVEAAAKYLKKLFHTNGDTKDLADKLKSLYEYIASDPELTWEGVKEQAAPIVEWLQDNEKFQRDQYAQDVLDTLKGQTFRLDETQLGEVNSQYGSLKDYRKAVKNMANSKAAQSLDQLWQELSNQYPDIFPPDTSASDMPLMFADALDRLDGMESTETVMDWRMKDQAMLEAVYDSYWRVSGLETVADKYAKKINEIRGKHYEKMTELRKDRDQKLKDLKADKQKAVKVVRENRDRAELRHKIQKHAKVLSQKLLKPSDNAHVPEELRHTVAQVLNAINMESQYSLDPETGKRKKAPDGLPVERTKAFLKLQQQCNAIMENGGNIIIDPEMADHLTDMLEWSDTPMAVMTKEQLKTVWEVLKSVEHSISTAGKMLSKTRWESVDGFAVALEQTAQSRGKRKQLTDRNIGLDMETPITFFSHFGEAGEEMFRMLRDAQDKEQVLQDLMGAETRKLATAKQIEQLESQVHQFTVGDQTLYLNTAQIMELYVLTKQEDARSHLLSENNGKGIVQPNVEGKLDADGKKKKVKVREGEQAVRMNAGELGTIIGSLSKEQRALADGIQKLTDLLAAEGNKASMQVYGYQKFTGKDYWPIRSSSLQLKEGVDKRLTPKRSVKNMSSAKNRQENAKNALTVPGIFDTFSRHCKEMTEYAAYLAVMEDLDRLYNYQYSEKTTNDQGEEVWQLTNKAAKGYLKQLAGTGADRYWMNLMEDLQNGIGSNSVWGYGTVGKAKAAAVSGNIRVILQQFTAFPRAAVCMKASDLVFGMTHSKGAWKRALQHSPTAMRKNAGTFDIGNAKQMKELLFDIHSGLDKANDALAKGAGWADAVTWGWLWRAAEHQAAKKLEIGTDAYWQEVNRIFTQVIDESQVIDGILQRSQYMRNPDGISKMQTAFMGEPTMALNLVLRSYDSWAYETDENKRKEAGKRLARAASGVVLANVLAAIAQSIPDAWRDDDEDKTYWERFAKALTGYDPEAEGWQQVKGIVLEGNLVSSLNPLGWVPWIKDVLSLIQGFDVSRADTDLIKDLVTAATNITNKDSTKTTAYRVKELAEVGVKLLGNGMSNILRDVYGFTHSVMVDTQNAAGLYTINALVHEPMANKGRYMNLLYRAISWGDTGGYEYVKQQLLTDGYTDGDIRDAMKERIKADYKENAIDRETAYDRLVKYASDPELDAEEAENELWFQLEAIDGKTAHQAENGNTDGYSYSRYDKVYAAVRGNGNFQEAVKEMTDHGYDKETVIGEVKSQIGQWQRDGEITEAEAKKMLTTYGGMEAEEAKARTKAWAWMKNNPKSEATVEQVEAYQRPLEGLNRSIENLGIDMDIYLKEKKTVDAFKSDKDEYGKSIAYSRINKAFPYINRLNLTRDQKTALAVACGWSYKTVVDNKLW